MSASACVAFYGLRYEVAPSEIEALEERRDPRQVAARKAGLQTYWGNFDWAEPRYVLLVGARLAVLGPENDPFASLSIEQLAETVLLTDGKLAGVNLAGDRRLHIDFQED
jgi:hypothetical protein